VNVNSLDFTAYPASRPRPSPNPDLTRPEADLKVPLLPRGRASRRLTSPAPICRL